RKKKTVLFLTLASLGLTAIPFVICILMTDFNLLFDKIAETDLMICMLVLISFTIAIIAYLVLHELVHGVAYKALTHEKLTFGLSWSCAFCGVPDVYVSRKTALVSLLAPFVVFSVLFLSGATVAYLVGDPIAFLYLGILFAIHFGGCVGDLWMTVLLSFRFRDKRLYMRDTGPEQFLYLPNDNVEANGNT
ncbi:MAG: DUF3267 domain-containing protein, partial [Clostridia bacterium]|nr:DUF3267 domain-containing protein [Clostridia bacterium]